MNQQEIEQWIAAQGGPSNVQYTTENRTIPNPDNPADPISKALADPNAPRTITVQVQTWVNKKTGAALSVKPGAADNQYEVIRQAGPAPATQGQTGPGRVQGVPNDPTIQVQQPDGSWVTQPNPNYRPPAAAQGQIVKAGDGKTYILHPDGSTTPTNLPPDAKPGTHTTIKGGDGKTYVVTVNQDGTVSSQDSGVPPEVKAPEKPDVRPDGKGGFVRVNPDGTLTAVSASEGTDPTFTGTPPPWVPKAVQDDLEAYAKQVGEAVASGAISKQRGLELVAERHRSAQAAVDNQLDAAKTIYGAGVSERGQDVSLANSRLSASQAGIQQGLSYFKEVNPWLKRGSTAGADAFLAIRNMAYQDAQRYGGLNDIPRTPVPAALQSAANSITITSPDGTTVTVPHGAGAAAPSPAAPAVPAMAPVQPDPGLVGPPPADPQQLAQGPQPTGFAAIDQYSKQIDSGMPTTVSGMEDSFRLAGMEEDAIAASRQNLLGAA